MKKVLASFHWNRGRLGEVSGLFVAREQDLLSAFGKRVYFGEILGKHSDISGILDSGDIRILSDEQSFIHKLVSLVGRDTISGYNPLKYLEEEE